MQLLAELRVRFIKQAPFAKHRLQAERVVLHDRLRGCVKIVDGSFDARVSFEQTGHVDEENLLFGVQN
jgi:hypothetical protein